MSTIKSAVIFCGSGSGYDPVYKEQAFSVGKTLAEQKIRIVYGGASIGLMGAVAGGALQHGGEVIGVLPHFLSNKEIAHDGLTEMILVENMHERKLRMHELSDAIITLPGGIGTMEETFEMLTWGQLGLHQKPIGLLNIRQFFQPLLQFCDGMMQEGFLNMPIHDMLLVSNDIDDLLQKIRFYSPPDVKKWITPGRS